MNDEQVVKNILSKYGIKDILKIEDKYYCAIIDRLIYDYREFDRINYTTSKFSNINNTFLKIIILLGGAIISYFKTKLVKQRINNLKFIDAPIIALPYADNIIRFMRLHEIIPDGFDIYYHPHYHFENIKRHINFYNKTKQHIYVDEFSLRVIIKCLYLVFVNFYKINKASKLLDKHFKSHTCKLPGLIIFSYIYRASISKFIRNKIHSNTQKKWLLDYDIDYKYIFFNSIIHQLRPQDCTIHIHHGSFYDFEVSYCNPVSDYSFCCSPREKMIIDKYNKYHSRINFLGAPLQTFTDRVDRKKNYKSQYDILLLLTDTYDQKAKETQVEFIQNINYSRYSVLARFRPSSKEHDYNDLSQYLSQASISNGTSLTEDVHSSKIVISFSEDALYTCLRNDKRIVLVCRKEPKQTYSFKYNSDNIKIIWKVNELFDSMLDLMIENYTNCNYDSDSFVQYNFGENSFEGIKTRFTWLINNYVRSN